MVCMRSIQNVLNYVNDNHEDLYLNTYNLGWMDHQNVFYNNHSQYFEEPPNSQQSNLEMLMENSIKTLTHLNLKSMMKSFMETQIPLNEEVRNQNLFTNEELRQLNAKVNNVVIHTKLLAT